jgi:two-component system nitrogen regulation sensor histidine kinase NtrY
MNLSGAYDQFNEWSDRHNVGRKLLAFLIVASTFSVIATYVMLTKASPFLKNQRLLISLLSIDFAFLLTLAALIAKYVAALWAERKSDQAGSKLHSRIVTIFSFLAVIPTILIAVLSAVFFNIVIQSWFNERVETAIGESIAVAGAYLGEHQKVISVNAQAMAAELGPMIDYLSFEPEVLDHKLTDQAQLRSLDEAIIFNDKMQVLGRSRFSFSLDFESIPESDLENAKTAPVIYTNEENDRVRALVAINTLENIYLLVGRGVSSTVLSRVENASKAAQEYARLESEGSKVALRFAAIFVGIAVLLLLAAVLGGLLFADKLAHPIRRLIQAADEVCRGNLSVRIADKDQTEELSSLTSAFNRMTTQLESQRDALMVANEQLDTRRKFTEAVLAGVSAWVIGLDEKGRIHLPNQSAIKLLKMDLTEQIGKKLVSVIPEMAPLFKELRDMGSDFIETQITLNRNGHGHTLLVRISVEHNRKTLTGFVVTFDDITQLQAAQRKAAWADMARRIAHEIKNPLTPIQLSAERLKRRYAKQISQDTESFDKCVETIIRQVDHIGTLVGEFSAFARMPSPNMKPENLVRICKEEIFLQQQAHPEIQFDFVSSLPSLPFSCDRAQMGQVLTNLLKNASEAIEAKGSTAGHIQISLKDDDRKIILIVSDNGIGLPSEGRERLTEPYVTFREKGTGLGLAIVKKIIEDHGGTLSFHDGALGGAEINISFSHASLAQQVVN